MGRSTYFRCTRSRSRRSASSSAGQGTRNIDKSMLVREAIELVWKK